MVIVVGSQNSSNSVRLVEVAVDAGARAAYLVDDAGSIDPAWLEGVSTVGLSSGASVPEDLVAGVLERLAESGFDHVEEVEAVEERMVFALPHELRPGRPARYAGAATACPLRPRPGRAHGGRGISRLSSGTGSAAAPAAAAPASARGRSRAGRGTRR